MRAARLLIALILAALALTSGAGPAAAQSAGGAVHVIELADDIDVVTADWLTGRLDAAADAGASVVVIALDTPGGLASATGDITRAISASPVPVAVWVGPGGARAASAGAFISASARYVLMAPATNIGSATPVSGGGDDLDAKVVNDAAASIAALAAANGHNAAAYRRMVTEATNLTAQEAVDAEVANALAPTLEDAVAWLDGRPDGAGGTIRTAGASVHTDTLPWYLEVLQVLVNPNLVFLLLLLGLIGLGVEAVAPGGIIPGALGLIALLLGIAGLQSLPFTWVGLALLVVGVALLFAETQVPGFGALAAGGVVALCLGGAFLFSSSEGSLETSLWVVIPLGVVLGGGTAVAARRVVRAHRNAPATGDAVLVGHQGVVRQAIGPGEGRVMVNGELWTARASIGTRIEPGAPVRVVRVDADGLAVEVEPMDPTTGKEN